ncbi:hypothetical protein ACU4GG_04965 [Streptomyces nojiriensis]
MAGGPGPVSGPAVPERVRLRFAHRDRAALLPGSGADPREGLDRNAPYDGAEAPVDCDGGPGLHTVPAEGGKATVRYGSRGVCLISAIPGPGFKVTTSQSANDTLTVTFTGSDHRSVITATIEPMAKASVRETSF